TTLPAESNTMTGFAAFAASSGFRVRGRCSSQTLSWPSIAKLEASPIFVCGGSLGQDLSTSNTGRLRGADCAIAVPASATPAIADNKILHAEIFRLIASSQLGRLLPCRIGISV